MKSSKLKTDGLFTAEDGPTDADAERTAPGRKQISGPSYTRADVEKYERIFSGRFAFGYGWEKVSGIPAKLSVSALYPDILTESEPESSDVFSLRPTTPRFLGDERAGADEKGTATHVFLQFCDFSSQDGSSGAVEKEIKRLLERSFISGRTASLINRNELSRFFGSAFFKEVRAAKSVWREKRFNVLIDASVLSASPERRRDLAGEKVLVQGVMDILLEMPDGSLVLCDYKTDRLTKEDRSTEQSVARIMRQRHGEQLGYYAQAVASLFGKAPSRILVFPLCYGEAVDITGTSDKAEI
jgi:ATP-dependent helicase/nuclease subunit A